MLETPAKSGPWQGRLPFFYGWVIVALGFFTSFFGIGLTWAASIFAVPMRDELGWSRSEIFFAVSMRGWIGVVASPVVGRYLDQRNGVRVMTLIGGLLNASSLLLISQVNAQWLLRAASPGRIPPREGNQARRKRALRNLVWTRCTRASLRGVRIDTL